MSVVDIPAVLDIEFSPGSWTSMVQTSGAAAYVDNLSGILFTRGVSLGIYFQQKLSVGFFGGEGFIMQKLEGDGLAFVHAAGSPDATRSHFDAQDFMESGTPGRKSTTDGWMNRLTGLLPGPGSPTRALSVGPVMPRILAGTAPASLALPTGAATGQAVAPAPAALGARARLGQLIFTDPDLSEPRGTA